MNTNKLYCLLAALCCLTFLSAQTNDSLRNFPAQASLVYPLGTNGVQSKNFSYNFSLNILTGKVGGLNGMEVSGLFGVVNNNAVGFQVAGLGNIVGDEMLGMQTAGIVNIVGDYAKGFQVSGLGNIVGDEMLGMQTAGIVNIVGDYANGFQVAGLGNIVGDEMLGMQTAGIVNIVGDCAKGLQVGGLANVVGSEMKGVQIAGIYNRAKTLKGLQIGILSINDTIESGGSLSLVNIVKKGAHKEWELSFADYNNAALSFKMGTTQLYTIYTVGVNFLEDNLWVVGIGFGNRTSISKRFDFQPELVSYNYFPMDFKNVQHTFATHLKFGFVYNINEKFGLTLAPNIYVLNIEKGNNSEFYKTSSFGSFYTNNSNNRQVKIGAGISVGLSMKH